MLRFLYDDDVLPFTWNSLVGVTCDLSCLPVLLFYSFSFTFSILLSKPTRPQVVYVSCLHSYVSSSLSCLKGS